jgi:hypothetical protein
MAATARITCMHATLPRPLAVAAVALCAFAGTAATASAKTLTASLNGKVEVPKGDTDGFGSARITTSKAKGKVCFDITLSKVGSVSAGHIHKGAKGKAGGVVVALFGKATKHPKGCVTGVKKSVISDIESHPARYYVNVHNSAFPGGAVRGQLRA